MLSPPFPIPPKKSDKTMPDSLLEKETLQDLVDMPAYADRAGWTKNGKLSLDIDPVVTHCCQRITSRQAGVAVTDRQVERGVS